MVKVPNGIETLLIISIADDSHTDDRRTNDDIANVNSRSRSLKTLHTAMQ